MPTSKKMTTNKKASKKAPSSGSDPKSKSIVKKKMAEVMDEFKHKQLKSGSTGEKVKNPKQAIAIRLSEARKAGAKIPPAPGKKKVAAKKGSATKRSSK